MTEECRIYLCRRDETIFCIVSNEDFAWASQWRWQFTWDRHRKKMYATRSTREAGNRRVKYYMHKQILERTGKVQPSPKHTIGDHGDGNSLNNQRYNIDWATHSMNAINRRKPTPIAANDNNIADTFNEKAA